MYYNNINLTLHDQTTETEKFLLITIKKLYSMKDIKKRLLNSELIAGCLLKW